MDIICDCRRFLNIVFINIKKYVISAILTFIILGIIAFILPNFYDITYEPLLGYAAFMAIISLCFSLLTWYLVKRIDKED